MDTGHTANAEQIALWNDTAGRAWDETQETLDAVLAPFEHLLVEAVAARGAKRVLDVGCGTGSTTLAIARQVGAAGSAVGVDISEPMIALANRRAARESAPPRFLCADAQTHTFEPAGFDMIVSRFGVMFFDDPVHAFENLRRAAAKGAALHVIAWRSAADNPFMTTAERAAAPFLPQLPARKPDEPGQFAFADRSRVDSILQEAGWSEIDIQPLDVECTLPKHELERYVTRLGPLGRALPQLDEQTRARVLDAVREASSSYVHGDNVRFTAACWIVGSCVR
jgi:ubiquinone/menaquinone biosynthesis C-methylase UbiE